MDKSEVLELFDVQQRKEVQYHGLRRDANARAVRLVATPPDQEGTVIYACFPPQDVEAVISEQIEFFESIGQDFEWKVYAHDKPPDLKERLTARGFQSEDPETVMVLDLNESSLPGAPRKEPDLRLVKGSDQIGDVVRVLQAVWQEDFSQLGLALSSELDAIPDRIKIYVAYVEGIPASVAWIRFHPGSQFASLWGGSTLAEYRKRGLYSSLLRIRSLDAIDRRVRFLTVDASPMSAPVLEKFGFKVLSHTSPCKWRRRIIPG